MLTSQTLRDPHLLAPARAVRTTKDALVVEGHRVTGAGLRRLLAMVNDDRHRGRQLRVRHTPWGDLHVNHWWSSPGLLPMEAELSGGAPLRPRLLVLDPAAADPAAVVAELLGWADDAFAADEEGVDYLGGEVWVPHPADLTGPVLRLCLPDAEPELIQGWLAAVRAGRLGVPDSPVRKVSPTGVLSRVVRALVLSAGPAAGERHAAAQVGCRVLTELLGEVGEFRAWAVGDTGPDGGLVARGGGVSLDGLLVTADQRLAVEDDEVAAVAVPVRGRGEPWPVLDRLGYLPPVALLSGVAENVLIARVAGYNELRYAGLSATDAAAVLVPVLQPPA